MATKQQLDWHPVTLSKKLQALADIAIKADTEAKAAIADALAAAGHVPVGKRAKVTLKGRFGQGPSYALEDAKAAPSASMKAKAIRI